MTIIVEQARKPRCFLLYAMAPEGFLPSDANRAINELIGLDELPLCLYHDHFIGQPGGLALFDVHDLTEVDQISVASERILKGWRIELRPLVFTFNPAAFDEQIAYTQEAYGKTDWNKIRFEKRPTYCDPLRETELASDD